MKKGRERAQTRRNAQTSFVNNYYVIQSQLAYGSYCKCDNSVRNFPHSAANMNKWVMLPKSSKCAQQPNGTKGKRPKL